MPLLNKTNNNKNWLAPVIDRVAVLPTTNLTLGDRYLLEGNPPTIQEWDGNAWVTKDFPDGSSVASLDCMIYYRCDDHAVDNILTKVPRIEQNGDPTSADYAVPGTQWYNEDTGCVWVAYMGNPEFGNHTNPIDAAVSVSSFANTNWKWQIIVPTENLNVSEISLYCRRLNAFNNNPLIELEIAQSNDGSGAAISSGSVTANFIDSTPILLAIPLTPVTLLAGTTYCFRFRAATSVFSSITVDVAVGNTSGSIDNSLTNSNADPDLQAWAYSFQSRTNWVKYPREILEEPWRNPDGSPADNTSTDIEYNNGTIRIGQYGVGTYDDSNPARVLTVTADGTVQEINQADLKAYVAEPVSPPSPGDVSTVIDIVPDSSFLPPFADDGDKYLLAQDPNYPDHIAEWDAVAGTWVFHPPDDVNLIYLLPENQFYEWENGVWRPGIYEQVIVTANQTLYVDQTNGDDLNDGLTPGNAFASYLGAFRSIDRLYQYQNVSVTLRQIGDYTSLGVVDVIAPTGVNTLTVRGDTETEVFTSNAGVGFRVLYFDRVVISGLEIQSTSGGTGISVINGECYTNNITYSGTFNYPYVCSGAKIHCRNTTYQDITASALGAVTGGGLQRIQSAPKLVGSLNLTQGLFYAHTQSLTTFVFAPPFYDIAALTNPYTGLKFTAIDNSTIKLVQGGGICDFPGTYGKLSGDSVFALVVNDANKSYWLNPTLNPIILNSGTNTLDTGDNEFSFDVSVEFKRHNISLYCFEAQSIAFPLELTTSSVAWLYAEPNGYGWTDVQPNPLTIPKNRVYLYKATTQDNSNFDTLIPWNYATEVAQLFVTDPPNPGDVIYVLDELLVSGLPTTGQQDRDKYLIDSSDPTEPNKVAEWDALNGIWEFHAPADINLVFLAEENQFYEWENGSWRPSIYEREIITTATNFYIDQANGSNLNDGKTIANAFASYEGALARIYQLYRFLNVSINLQQVGPYTSNSIVSLRPIPGVTRILVLGNGGIQQFTTNATRAFFIDNGGLFEIRTLEITSSLGQQGVAIIQGDVVLRDLVFRGDFTYPVYLRNSSATIINLKFVDLIAIAAYHGFLAAMIVQPTTSTTYFEGVCDFSFGVIYLLDNSSFRANANTLFDDSLATSVTGRLFLLRSGSSILNADANVSLHSYLGDEPARIAGYGNFDNFDFHYEFSRIINDNQVITIAADTTKLDIPLLYLSFNVSPSHAEGIWDLHSWEAQQLDFPVELTTSPQAWLWANQLGFYWDIIPPNIIPQTSILIGKAETSDNVNFSNFTPFDPDVISIGQVQTTPNSTTSATVKGTAQNNLNDSLAGTAVVWNAVSLEQDGAYNASPQGLIVYESGKYLAIAVHSGIVAANGPQRASVAIKITVNNAQQSKTGRTGYIRRAGGHFTSTTEVTERLTLAAGDIVGALGIRTGAGGIVSTNASETELFLMKLNEL